MKLYMAAATVDWFRVFGKDYIALATRIDTRAVVAFDISCEQYDEKKDLKAGLANRSRVLFDIS